MGLVPATDAAAVNMTDAQRRENDSRATNRQVCYHTTYVHLPPRSRGTPKEIPTGPGGRTTNLRARYLAVSNQA